MTQLFTSANATAVKEMLVAHLNTFPSQDYDFDTGSMSGSAQELTITIKVRPKGAKSGERVLLETYAGLHGIDLEKTAYIRGAGTCKLVSYNPRNKKLHWIVENENGKGYKLETPTVLEYFKIA